MNLRLLNTEIQEFITTNLKSDISKLLLKGIGFKDIDDKDIIEQIEAKKRCEKKLPTWYNASNIYYPNRLNIEQTSSEIAALYKTKFVSGKSLIDLTGGFGVDAYYFSKIFNNVTHCEINEELTTLVNHNLSVLNVKTIKTIPEDGIKYLLNSNKTYDWIYIDPSRRHDSKGKVFFLKDCLPNVPEHLLDLFGHTNNILVKTAPLLDISAGIEALKFIKSIHVVAVNNEVKELLWVLEKNYCDSISVLTVNIKEDVTESFKFKLNAEADQHVNLSEPHSYLYEPNAAILKAGAFKTIAKQYDLTKLHQHSHLYTSSRLIKFPGRRFKVEKVVPFNKKLLKAEAIKKAHITTRNFPLSVEHLRKLLKIKNGGSKYLFFTTSIENKKVVIITTKV